MNKIKQNDKTANKIHVFLFKYFYLYYSLYIGFEYGEIHIFIDKSFTFGDVN